MNELKKKAMLDTAKIFACALGGTALLHAILYYGPMLPFTAEDYGMMFALGLLVFTARLAYKMRLEELERRERIAKSTGIL